MISFQNAIALILSKAHSFGQEDISLENGLGRVLEGDVFAPRDLPPFNRSAMDGVALRLEDLSIGIKEFRCIETIFAGSLFSKKIQRGECYKIMTGASVPEFADVVIRVEDTLEQNEKIEVISRGAKRYQNISLKGQDLETAALAIRGGTCLNAATIGLLASLGKGKIAVKKLPTVNFITTGDEIIELQQEISPITIYNSNKYVLTSLLKQLGIEIDKYTHVLDDPDALRLTIKKNLQSDILIITGGVSAGQADFIPSILEELGASKNFHKVAIKPGKPIWCGQLGKTMIFALPGNPFSCLVTFKLFVEFYINTSLRGAAPTIEKLPLNFERIKKTSLDEFFPVIIKNGMLNKVDINGSGDVRLGFAANALAMHAADENILTKGSQVAYLPL
ncbi:molybdopterin molybdotransferase [Pedobacter sp. UYP30]|uniref:molybdopterin molybdotransferase MoeA n=1 Tax=Pedobacter sp. UYP30 TaxID=1756400 RepID=UPI003399C7DC